MNPEQKHCPHCMSVIHAKAKVCPQCRKRIDGRPRWYNIGCATFIGLFLVATGLGFFGFTAGLGIVQHLALIAGAVWLIALLIMGWLPFMG